MGVPKPQMEEGFSFLSLKVVLILVFLVQFTVADSHHKHAGDGVQPLSKIQIHRAVYELHENASVKAYPILLGTKGEDSRWMTVEVASPKPSEDDWLAVSPANFNSSTCPSTDDRQEAPYICSAPIKYRFANDSNAHYVKTGEASLKFQLINQCACTHASRATRLATTPGAFPKVVLKFRCQIVVQNHLQRSRLEQAYAKREYPLKLQAKHLTEKPIAKI